MMKFVQPPTAVRWIVVFVAILSLSTLVMAQQDTLDDTKDVIIDEPADKIEDVFDEPADKVEDVFDDDDNDYDVDHDRIPSCAVDKDDDCDPDLDDEDCGVDLDYSACEVEENDCDLDVDEDDCDLDVDEDDCDLDVEEDDCDLDVDEDDCDLDVDDDACEVEEIEMEKPTICQQTTAVTPDTGPMVISLEELEKDPEAYYGKTVTVVGELHRIFNDKVFTIEDDGFFRDKDVLVINQGSNCADIEACNDEFEPGKDLRITGVVVPYNRGKLECEHGPLDLESREGHSFTKNPVLIVGRTETAAVIEIEREKPAVVEPTPEPPPAPEPAPEPPVFEPTPEPAPEPLPELPRTASESPLLGLIGVLSLCAAFVMRRSAAERSR